MSDKVSFSGNQLTTPLNTLKYYNIYKGDEYMYRPTGYLYMIGRKQYFDFYGADAINNPYEYYKDNTKSLDIALKVWRSIEDPNASGMTSYEYSKMKNALKIGGSHAIFEHTRVVSQQFKHVKKEDTATIFKRILETFYDKTDKKPLIDYANP